MLNVSLTENEVKTIVRGLLFAQASQDPRVAMQCVDLSEKLASEFFPGVSINDIKPTIDDKYTEKLTEMLDAILEIAGELREKEKSAAPEKRRETFTVVRGEK